MSALAIQAHRKLPQYVVTTKEVTSHATRAETPTRSRPVELFDDGEELLDSAYGFAEAHVEVSSTDLEALAEGEEGDVVATIAEQSDAVDDDEIGVAVVEYSGRGIVSIPGMEALVDHLGDQFDILIGPLMSESLDSVDLDDNPEPYNRFLENTERWLDAVEATGSDTGVLGTIPVLSWDRMEELLQIHLENDVDGFCVDFLAKKPTARRRIASKVAPLLGRLAIEQRHRSSLLYAVNAYHGQNRTGAPGSPAENFYVFGLGIDVLGDRYYFPGSGRSDEEVTKFRWFDSDTYEQEYVPVDDLEDVLPENTGLDQQHITALLQDDGERGRAQVLLEIERMNVAYDGLREAIQSGRTAEYFTGKPGSLDRIESVLETVQDEYDEGSSNPSLSSF